MRGRNEGGRLLELGAAGLEALADGLADGARVLRFLRGRAAFQLRPDDLFVVTYPRSGTTWMQYIVYLLHCGATGPDFDHISQVAPWFERSMAAGALSARDLAALPAPRIFKSHLARCWLPRRARCVCVIRDGRDVALSYYHFYRSHLRYEGSFEQFFARFLRGELQYKSWFKHTAAWRAAAERDARVLPVRYEALRRAPRRVIEAVAAFCGLAPPPARLDLIAELSSFERMKQHEARFDFTTELLLQHGYRPGAFLRSGQAGGGQRALTPAQEAAYAAAERVEHPGLELDLPQFLR